MAFGTTATRALTRAELSSLTQEVGEAVNRLKVSLMDAQHPFTAGVLRGAEESVLVVKTMLDDTQTQESEL